MKRLLLNSYHNLVSNVPKKSYASLLSKDQQGIILSKDNEDSIKQSLDLFEQNQLRVFVESVLYASNIRFKNSSLLKDIRDENIIFNTNDTILGYDLSLNYGQNLYGEHLMKLRSELWREECLNELEKRKRAVNEIYSLYKDLLVKLINGNDDLSEYVGMHYKDILDLEHSVIIELDNPLVEMYINGNGYIDKRNYKEDDINMINMINFFIIHPTKMAEYLRVKFYKQYNLWVEDRQKENLTKYYLSTLFKDSQKVKEKLKELDVIEPLENFLLSVKQKSDKLKDYELTPSFIEEKDVQDIVIDNLEWVYKSCQLVTNKNSSFIITTNDFLSPLYNDKLEIGLLEYSSIYQYAVVKMLHNIKQGKTMKECRQKIEKGDMFVVYHQLKTEYIHDMVKFTSENLLNEMVKKSYFIKMLAPLKNTEIIYANESDYDYILGIGKLKNGENLLGSYLSQLSKEIKDIPKKEQKESTFTSKLFTDLHKFDYSLEKISHLYEMATLLKTYIKIRSLDSAKMMSISDTDSCLFMSNFLCINRNLPANFYDKKMPDDFNRLLNIKTDSDTVYLLYKYIINYYSSLVRLEKEDSQKRSFDQILSNKHILYSMATSILEKVENKDYPFVLPPDEKILFNRQFINQSEMYKRFNLKNQSDIEYEKFKITDESEYSSLMPKHVKEVRQIFKLWFSHVNVIVDATAHIGVDTINFSKIYPSSKIISYEINPDTFNLLKDNVKTLGNGNIYVKNNDFSEVFLSLKDVSFVYIDAPWGGKDYKNVPLNQFDLYLSGKNIKDIARELLVNKITSSVVLKVPFNYKISGLEMFKVERRDVIDKSRISYILLKLTMKKQMIQKFLKLKTLLVDSFVNIFETLQTFIDVKVENSKGLGTTYLRRFELDEKDILFAFKLLGWDNLNTKTDNMFIPNLNTDLVEKVSKYTESEEMAYKLTFLLQKSIQHILNKTNHSNFSQIVSTALKYSNSTKMKYSNIYKEYLENYFMNENESDESDDSESDNESNKSDESDIESDIEESDRESDSE